MVTGRQQHLNQSLLRIPRRAENSERHTASKTYVEAGSFAALLHSSDHQIRYGRRGTGKTHALLHLADLLTGMGDVAVYVDLRTIGSAGGIHADSTQSAAARGTQLLIDALKEVHDGLLTVAMERDIGDPTALLRELDALAEAATTVKVVGEVERETTVSGEASATRSAEVTLSTRPGLRSSARQRRSVTARSRLLRVGVERHQVMFGPLSRAVRGIVRALAPARLWLLLDEWSSPPAAPRDRRPAPPRRAVRRVRHRLRLLRVTAARRREVPRQGQGSTGSTPRTACRRRASGSHARPSTWVPCSRPPRRTRSR